MRIGSLLVAVAFLLATSGAALSDKLPKIKLESLTTTAGKTYTNLTVTSRTDDSISIRHSSGVASLSVEEIPEKQLEELGFDPAKVEALLNHRTQGLFRLISYEYNGNPKQREKVDKLGAYTIHGNTGMTFVFQIDPKTLGQSQRLTFTFKVADVPYAASKGIVRLVADEKLLTSTKGAKRGESISLNIPKHCIGNSGSFEVSLLGGKDSFGLAHSNRAPLVSLRAKPLSEKDKTDLAKLATPKAALKKRLEVLRKSSRPRTFVVDRVTKEGGLIVWGTTRSYQTLDIIPRKGHGGAAPSGQVSYSRRYYLSGIPNPERFARLDYIGGIFSEDGTHSIGNGVNLTKWVFLGLKAD